jgi:hypothetical protein
MTAQRIDQKVKKKFSTTPFLITWSIALYPWTAINASSSHTFQHSISGSTDPQAIDFFGIKVQVAGQSLIILSFNKSKSNNKMKGMQAKTQQTTEGFKENFKQFQISLQTAISINNSYHANARFDVF